MHFSILFWKLEEVFKEGGDCKQFFWPMVKKIMELVKLKKCCMRQKMAGLIHVFTSAISINFLGSYCLHQKNFNNRVFLVRSSILQLTFMSCKIKNKSTVCQSITHAFYFNTSGLYCLWLRLTSSDVKMSNNWTTMSCSCLNCK